MKNYDSSSIKGAGIGLLISVGITLLSVSVNDLRHNGKEVRSTLITIEIIGGWCVILGIVVFILFNKSS
ncbi:MAG: hypothetical protein HZC38_03365 [Chloroflexi bacterium]|nr:hypothetical protein [Chloroflexota bacterium]